MFYNYELLCYAKKGKFSVIWLAGNHKKLSQKQIMSVNIEASSLEIIQTVKTSSGNKKERFSLYLSSVLMTGLCIIKNRQCELLLDQVTDWFMFQMATKTLHEDLSIRWTISPEKDRVKWKKRKREEPSVDFETQALRELQAMEQEISLQPQRAPLAEIPLQPERSLIVPKVQTQEKALMSLVHEEDDDEIMQQLDKIFGQQEGAEAEQRLPVDEGVPVPSESATAQPDVQGLSRTTADRPPSMEVIRYLETPPAVALFSDIQPTSMTGEQRSPSFSLHQQPAPLLQIPEVAEELPMQPPEAPSAPADAALTHTAEVEAEAEAVAQPRKRRRRSLSAERRVHPLPVRDRRTELTFNRANLRVDLHKEYEDVMSSWMKLAPPDEHIKNFLPLREGDVIRGLSDTPDRLQLTLGQRSSGDRSRGKTSGEGEKQILHAPELFPIVEEAAPQPESAVMQESLLPEPPREEKSLSVPVAFTEPVPEITDFPRTTEPDVTHMRDLQEERAEHMEVEVATHLPQVKTRQEQVPDLSERLSLIIGLSDEVHTFDDICPLSTAKSTAACLFLDLLDQDNRGNIFLKQDNTTDFAPIYIKSTVE